MWQGSEICSQVVRVIGAGAMSSMNSFLTYLLEQTPVYSLWQAPFITDKLTPVLAHNDMARVRRVLDVGCGPGTNTDFFRGADYLGVDINPGYIESAQRKHKRRFVVADVTAYDDQAAGKFDFILINSFLHHVDDADADKVLARMAGWLTPDGYIHIVEVVLPGDRSIAQLLASWDRGSHTRSLERWRTLFERHLEIAVFETYSLKLIGARLWSMVYCKGRGKP
jgi:SAM-dependent methyltransferase